MARATRQLKILDIISKYDIDTQEELVYRLRAEGFNVTQATISRDIKDMGIIKSISVDGRHYKYTAQKTTETTPTDKFLNMFKTSVISVKAAGNLVVVKTETVAAKPACELIDNLNLDGVLGTVAGDNAIFIACSTADDAESVRRHLEDLMYSPRG